MAWTKERIIDDLRELGAREGDTLLVHASMRAIGKVEGGADTMVDALLEVLGPEGTLLTPAFNAGNRVPEKWATADIRSLPALYSNSDTPEFVEGISLGQVGALAGRVHARSDSRGSHPTLAFSALGRNAAFLTGDAPFHYPLGTNSPLARLHQLNGGILLVGVDQTVNASLHLAENWADAPYSRRKAMIRMPDQTAMEMEGSPECSAGFAKIEPVLRQARILRTGYIGNAPSHLMRAQYVVSMAMEMIRGNPESLLCDNPDCSACTLGRKFTSQQDAS